MFLEADLVDFVGLHHGHRIAYLRRIFKGGDKPEGPVPRLIPLDWQFTTACGNITLGQPGRVPRILRYTRWRVVPSLAVILDLLQTKIQDFPYSPPN